VAQDLRLAGDRVVILAPTAAYRSCVAPVPSRRGTRRCGRRARVLVCRAQQVLLLCDEHGRGRR
jgi:hypothetical protein